ncbi:GNAT family N-acetyltransferase [Bacillus suaedaesalsae]|uniref:GNAT family N-acetyltransferase n=1 Tax=Bacillus suaedaesalsae TaxID=2810349 RepID=A0ABS2DK96_9BACI|nr:GNAT family N-acetyltransferase [Bacillus suaedaesalsae]MBM6617893.1 GNAT family N-acetyltransferase [Bacillus suaedaesalsae]
MEEIIQQLKKLGVHVLCNHDDILVEIPNHELLKWQEADRCIHELLKNRDRRVVLECSKTILDQLPTVQEKMTLIGERILFSKTLSQSHEKEVPSYEVWPPFDSKSISFLSEVMNVSNEKAKRFLENMKSELPTQVDNMYTVYMENDVPIGVVFPHIEPDTNQEGRMFWIGIHLEHQGKGYAKALHSIGLFRLQHDFHAKMYVGATKVENIPMQKVMITNGCVQQKHKIMTFEYNNEE